MALNRAQRRQQAKKLTKPPYSSPIFAARRAGLVPKLDLGHVTIVFDWRPKYINGIPYVVMPAGKDPLTFDWSFCKGLQVVIVHLDEHIPYITGLVLALYKAGVRDLKVMNTDRLRRRERYAWVKLNWLTGENHEG